MLKKIVIKILFISVFCILVSGCYDNYDLEERQLCTAIAVDYSDDEGYEIILSVPVSEGDNEVGRALKTHKGKTLAQVINDIDSSSSKKLYFGHTRAVVLGMGLLKSERAIAELTDYLVQNVQIDKNILLVAAYDINNVMQAEPAEDKLTGFYISGFYESGKEEKTFVNKENLLNFLKDEADSKSAAIPIMSVEGNSPVFGGMAILKGTSLGGTLSRDEAYGFMWLKDMGFSGTLSSSRLPISADIVEKETNYGFREENGNIVTDVYIKAAGNMWNYTDNEISTNGAEYLEAFKNEIEMQTSSAIKRLKEIDCDALQLTEALKERNRSLYTRYSDLISYDNINVNIDFSLNLV